MSLIEVMNIQMVILDCFFVLSLRFHVRLQRSPRGDGLTVQNDSDQHSGCTVNVSFISPGQGWLNCVERFH